MLFESAHNDTTSLSPNTLRDRQCDFNLESQYRLKGPEEPSCPLGTPSVYLGVKTGNVRAGHPLPSSLFLKINQHNLVQQPWTSCHQARRTVSFRAYLRLLHWSAERCLSDAVSFSYKPVTNRVEE